MACEFCWPSQPFAQKKGTSPAHAETLTMCRSFSSENNRLSRVFQIFINSRESQLLNYTDYTAAKQHWIPVISTFYRWFSWIFHGFALIFIDFPWISMDFHWFSMDFPMKGSQPTIFLAAIFSWLSAVHLCGAEMKPGQWGLAVPEFMKKLYSSWLVVWNIFYF